MTYAKQTWNDAPSTASPLSAARLNNMEQGISDADVTTAGSPAAVALAAAVANGAPVWQSYAPSWTGLTVGNGVVTARYTVSGKTATVSVALIFGSTTVISGTFFPSMPVNMGPTNVGAAWGFDASATAWAVGAFAPGEYLLFGSGRANATAPWTWTGSDQIKLTITGEIA